MNDFTLRGGRVEVSPQRLTYDIPHRAFYLDLRPVKGKVGGWQVLTSGRLLVGDTGTWIGIEATPTEDEVHDEQSPLPPEVVEAVRRPLRVVWAAETPVRWLDQEFVLDWDEEGVNGIEILLFMDNKHIGFDAVRGFGENIG